MGEVQASADGGLQGAGRQGAGATADAARYCDGWRASEYRPERQEL